jgi:hypothetical protein
MVFCWASAGAVAYNSPAAATASETDLLDITLLSLKTPAY